MFQVVFCVQSISASPLADKQAKLIEKVKEGISKLGVGKDALVEVKLRDKAKLAGYVSEARQDSFAITDAKTGTATTVAYADVAQVKGHNLSTGAKIGIGIAIGFAVTALVIYLVVRH
jgi:hypothetical protein